MKIFELNEADITTGKLTDVKPGAEATIDMGDGTKTVVDLKKNPTALVKSPDGKVMFNKSGMTSGGVQPEQPDPTSMFKPGEPVTITSTQTENLDQNQDTFYFFDVARGAHSYRDQDLIDMGLKKSRSGKWYYRPRRSESEMSLRGKINRLEKILNIKAKIWKPELHELSIEAKPVDDQDYVNENLRKWFKEKWVRFGPDGKIRGECGGKDDSEGKPKCLPASKAHALGKKGRASAGARKRREDPNPDRSGAAINVATKKNEDAAMDQKPGRFNQAHQDLYKRNTPRFGGDSGMPGAQDIRQGTGSTVDRSGNPIGGLAVGVAKPGGVPKVSKIPVTRFGMAGTRDHDPKLGADLDPKSLMKNYDKDKIDEKWSEKYKRSIDCDNPRGFSQRAHCQGRDKNEAVETLDEKCWDTHKQVGMKRKGDRMVPNCVPREDVQEQQQMCPECGGAMYEASLMNEKKDACYYKVKSRYKVWPSAYASGALVKCRKKGAKNWGSKSESMAEGGFDIPEIPRAPTPKPPKQPGVVEDNSQDIVVRLDGETVPGRINDIDHARNKASKLISYGKGKVAEVYVNGKLKMRMKLNTPREYFDERGIEEGSKQELSIQELATISDEALDNAYGYGRSSPGNSFGWQANLMSAAYAKKMIDADITDIDKIADAIHKGWNVTARKFVQDPDQFDDTEKLRQAGKLDAKLQQRAKLMKIDYDQLNDEEQEKDRVVARALLQAIKGQQGVAEGFDELAAYMKAAMAPRPRGDAGIKRGTYGQPGRRRGRPVGPTGGEGSNIPHAVDFDRPHSERSAGRRLPRFSDDFDAMRRSDVDENSVRNKLHRRHQELRKKSGLPDPDYYKEFARSYDIEDDKQRMAVQAEIKRKYKVK
jgi:hypothetical protein